MGGDYVQQDLFGNVTVEKRPISREELCAAITPVLRRLSLSEFVSLITNEFSEVLEYADLSVGRSACQKTSLLYNPHRLDIKSRSSKFSIYGALQTDSFCNGLARALLFKKGKVNELLYQSLQLGINGVQYINEFPPLVAREMAVKYGCNKDSLVLDPCAGWGGRMIGISTVSDKYVGFEPSTRTYAGLVALKNGFIYNVNPSFDATIHNQCFEDSELPENSFDFAITSPPYYDTEEYSDEPTNSLNRYSTFDLWLTGFFFPLIQKTMAALKPDKVFVLNIGSRVYPLSSALLDEFGDQYQITCIGNELSGNSGLGKSGEGESFYAIKKARPTLCLI